MWRGIAPTPHSLPRPLPASHCQRGRCTWTHRLAIGLDGVYKHVALVEWEDGHALERKTDGAGSGASPPTFSLCLPLSFLSFFPTSELPSSDYSSPRIPSIPALPAPNVIELVIVSLASTLPEVHLLPSVPQHHHHPAVLAIVLEGANIKCVASGRVASASRDAASQRRAVAMASALAQDMHSGENFVVRTPDVHVLARRASISARIPSQPPPRSRSIALECMSPHLYRRLHVLTGTPRIIFLFPCQRSSRPSSSTDAAGGASPNLSYEHPNQPPSTKPG
jgi:hypothetical protein